MYYAYQIVCLGVYIKLQMESLFKPSNLLTHTKLPKIHNYEGHTISHEQTNFIAK